MEVRGVPLKGVPSKVVNPEGRVIEESAFI
jgi:hypothetical protein